VATILDELVGRIEDPDLRAQIAEQVARVQSTKEYGLIFPRHLPERVRLPNHPVRRRTVVTLRDGTSNDTWVVKRVAKGTAHLLDSEGTELARPVEDLVVVRRFGEPAFPGLVSVGKVERGGAKPWHTAINAENYHALEALSYAYEEQVDCIYIDPPYNSGAKDWKYNNDYVDGNDSFRHSKWLSFMEKRLRLARRLLKPDSVLVLTIDENEVHQVGMLLEDLFPEAGIQTVTIVNNAAGVSQGGLWRVEEYAFFCWFGNARPCALDDDLLSDEAKTKKPVLWFSLTRSGGINATPARRPNLVYPIGINPETLRVAGTGRTLKDRMDAGEVTGDLNDWRPDPSETVNGFPVVWPFTSDGALYTWQMSPDGLTKTAGAGFIKVREHDGFGTNSYSVSYMRTGNQKRVLSGDIPNAGREPNDGPYILAGADVSLVPKTVWKRARHDAGKWGSRTLRELLGTVSFDYAKSPYAVLDTLRICCANNPDALILDFFSGSGTTAHATMLLNAMDDGRRRSISVTNNEVSDEESARLRKKGLVPGDPEWEAAGIFQAVTKPRITAAATGCGRDGTPLSASYQDETPMSDGFPENIEFFELTYLDRTDVERGQAFASIAPLLWMEAGAKGERIDQETADYSVSESAGYAVLFDVGAWSGLAAQLDGTDTVKHVFIVTDSLAQYQQIVAELPPDVRTRQLYSDYLTNFELNTGGAA
jgi:adenine-specific DNA-methyltransferase